MGAMLVVAGPRSRQLDDSLWPCPQQALVPIKGLDVPAATMAVSRAKEHYI